jgi:hypothetical protein
MSPRGGIAKPPERHYSETRAGCQLAGGGRWNHHRVRLGRGNDSPEQQSTLARAIYRDHLLSFARMIVVLGLQLAAQ